MPKISKRTGVILVIYALVLSFLLYIGLMQIISNTKQSNMNIVENYNAVAYLNQDDINKIITNNKEILKNNIQPSTVYVGRYNDNLDDNIIKLVIFFFIILLLSITVLWYVIVKFQRKEANKVVVDLKELINTKNSVYNEEYQDGYDIVYKNIADDLEDYRKLNAYLSHEQKNILARLKVNAADDLKEELDKVNDSIEDILTLTETKGMDNLEEVDIVLETAELVDEYSKKYPRINFDFDDEIIIMSKSRWIKRAISNLIDNAIKYGNNKPIDIKIKKKEPSVVIEVIDYGKGIEQSKLSAIFNHNYRINNLNSDGYGIGLSLVSHVCDLCNGYIYVDSELNHKTTFYLSFPLVNIQ